MSLHTCSVIMCVFLAQMAAGTGVQFVMERHPDNYFCGHLQCLADFTHTDHDVASFVEMTIYDITRVNSELRLASVSTFDPDLYMDTTKSSSMGCTGTISSLKANLTLQLRHDIDCLYGVYKCQLDLVTVSERSEVLTEIVTPEYNHSYSRIAEVLSHFEKLTELLNSFTFRITAQINKLTSQSDDQTAKLVNQTILLNRLASQSDYQAAKIDRLANQSDYQTVKIDRLANQSDNQAAMIHRLANQSDDQTAKIDRLASQSDYQTVKIDRLANQSDYQSVKIDRLASQSDYQTVMIDRLASQSDYQTVKIDRLANQSDYQTVKIDRLANQSDYQTVKIDRLANQSDYQTVMIDRLANQSDYQTVKIDRLASQSDYQTAKIDRLASQSDYQTVKIDRLANQSDYQTVKIDRLANQSDYQTVKIDRLASQSDYQTVKIDRLANQSDQLVDQTAQLVDQTAHLHNISQRCDQDQADQKHRLEVDENRLMLSQEKLDKVEELSNLSIEPVPDLGACSRGKRWENSREKITLWGNITALCDTTTDGGGWVIIQRRVRGDVDFYRGWDDYKKGFGNLDTDFWIGNDIIHNLTSQGYNELRIDFVYNGTNYFAQYTNFHVADESSNYRITISGFSGNVYDSMEYHNGSSFSTPDRDNDLDTGSCSVWGHGSWWYNACFYANLNGAWTTSDMAGIYWSYNSKSNHLWWSLTFTEMKIR